MIKYKIILLVSFLCYISSTQTIPDTENITLVQILAVPATMGGAIVSYHVTMVFLKTKFKAKSIFSNQFVNFALLPRNALIVLFATVSFTATSQINNDNPFVSLSGHIGLGLFIPTIPVFCYRNYQAFSDAYLNNR